MINKNWIKGIMEGCDYKITSFHLAKYLGKRHLDVKRKIDKGYKGYVSYYSDIPRWSHIKTKMYKLDVNHLKIFKEIDQEILDKMESNKNKFSKSQQEEDKRKCKYLCGYNVYMAK